MRHRCRKYSSREAHQVKVFPQKRQYFNQRGATAAQKTRVARSGVI